MDKVIKDELFLEDNNDNRRQQLEIFISSGRYKELINKDLTLKDLEQMKGKDVEKFYKMYESAMASKVSSSICNSIISIASMLLDKTLPIHDVKTLEMELHNDYILTSQLRNVCGYLSLNSVDLWQFCHHH